MILTPSDWQDFLQTPQWAELEKHAHETVQNERARLPGTRDSHENAFVDGVIQGLKWLFDYAETRARAPN